MNAIHFDNPPGTFCKLGLASTGNNGGVCIWRCGKLQEVVGKACGSRLPKKVHHGDVATT